MLFSMGELIAFGSTFMRLLKLASRTGVVRAVRLSGTCFPAGSLLWVLWPEAK